MSASSGVGAGAVMPEVRITSTKWDGAPHRDNSAFQLGEDAHGLWLWMPQNTVVTTSTGSYKARPGLRLIPTGTWWSAYFVPPHPPSHRPRQWYVDITTPAVRAGHLVSFVDLDLDVERLGDGPVALLDEDEFAANQVAMAYPCHIATQARRVAAEMLQRMSSGAEPFGVASERWLARVAEAARQ